MEDYGLDPDDIALDIAERVAFRAGRSLDGCEANPWNGKAQTLGGMVQFFNSQPRTG